MYSNSKIYQTNALLTGQLYFNSFIFNANTAFTDGILWKSEKLINRSTSLALYFGNNAVQDGNYLYIKKSDLISLIPSANNTAESLLVALINRLINITDDYVDVISIRLFDTYINKNKITYTILIEIFYPATPEQIELNEPLEINPNNYGL